MHDEHSGTGCTWAGTKLPEHRASHGNSPARKKLRSGRPREVMRFSSAATNQNELLLTEVINKDPIAYLRSLSLNN